MSLDLNVFMRAMDRKQLPDALYDDMLFKLSVIETCALKQIHKQR